MALISSQVLVIFNEVFGIEKSNNNITFSSVTFDDDVLRHFIIQSGVGNYWVFFNKFCLIYFNTTQTAASEPKGTYGLPWPADLH